MNFQTFHDIILILSFNLIQSSALFSPNIVQPQIDFSKLTQIIQLLYMILKGKFQILKGYENNHVTIGFGSYGQVKLAKDIQSGQIVAVKIVNKIANNEVSMHIGLSHPKIIKLLDVHIDTQRKITYMILEYAGEGSLYQKVKMNMLTRCEIRKYFKDVCEGLAYLHSQNIMHRDIKPENILLTKNNQAKLCDFGFAALLGERKTLCGTYEYMSPEMIQNKPYDHQVDIWALGILLFQLIGGSAPFRGEKPQEVLEKMKTKIYFCERFELEDINLVKMILRVTPGKRPSINQILEQPFFKEIEESKKIDETNASTCNSEESKIEMNSMMYMSESCSPKRMVGIQKTLQKQTQKQTYPPFISKAQRKIEQVVTLQQIKQTKQSKNNSPTKESKIYSSTNINKSPTYFKNSGIPSLSKVSFSNSNFTGLLKLSKPASHPSNVDFVSPSLNSSSANSNMVVGKLI